MFGRLLSLPLHTTQPQEKQIQISQGSTTGHYKEAKEEAMSYKDTGTYLPGSEAKFDALIRRLEDVSDLDDLAWLEAIIVEREIACEEWARS